MPFVIGLTGSIGMGKSTTAQMFAEDGAAVWDADSAVHRLYEGGEAVAAVGKLCPAAVEQGRVRRDLLSLWLQGDPSRLARLEAVVHPLVARDRADFLRRTEADIVVLDIPLLLEGGGVERDLTVVVSAPVEVQHQRVLARPGMTPEKLAAIEARQMPDAQKRARADVIIDTSTLAGARRDVQRVMQWIRAGDYARDRSGHRDDRA
jgi:dephospho-CoA kinase